MLKYLILISSYLLSTSTVLGYNVTVKTAHGYVQGYEATSGADSSVKYYAFQGVPFGEPPVGSLRFQDPIPVSSWEGVKETKALASACAAHESASSSSAIIGSEDCLYLNVYVPKMDADNEDLSLPVMVFFHGGAFVRGSPRSSPDYLMEKPVIVVMPAYRLGVLGFLSTLDDNARGNAGLKDQTLALKWVQENIHYFGGNASRVTIFGASAGGASVEYHLVSPLSSGLFSQAISESGSTLNEWGFRYDPYGATLTLAEYFNVSTSDTKTIVEGLQKVDYVTLIQNSQHNGRFQPHVESESEYAFIDRSSYDIWTSGDFNKVPAIIGYNNEDGSYGYALASQYAKNPKAVIPAGLGISSDSAEADEVVEKITELYFPGYSYDNFTNDIDFMTQHYFARGIRKSVGDYAKYNTHPVYFYRFSYATNESYYGGVNGGAGHGEEAKYILRMSNLSEKDTVIKNRMVAMWTNFAIYGNPTPEEDELLQNIIWPNADEDVEGDDIRYLEIGENLVVGTNPDQEDFLFWKQLFQDYAVSTIYTY